MRFRITQHILKTKKKKKKKTTLNPISIPNLTLRPVWLGVPPETIRIITKHKKKQIVPLHHRRKRKMNS